MSSTTTTQIADDLSAALTERTDVAALVAEEGRKRFPAADVDLTGATYPVRTSTAYSPVHIAKLSASAISPEWAAARGVVEIDGADSFPAEVGVAERARWARIGDGRGMCYRHVEWTSEIGSPIKAIIQYNPDMPIIDSESGRALKYMQQAGSGTARTISKADRDKIASGTAERLIIVEGTKQTLAVQSLYADDPAVAVVGMIGCWGGMIDGVPPRWLTQAATGRRVVLLFDADVATNIMVWDAAKALHSALDPVAADVRLGTFGSGHDGIDDHLGRYDAEVRRTVLDKIIADSESGKAAGRLPKRPKAKASAGARIRTDYVSDRETCRTYEIRTTTDEQGNASTTRVPVIDAIAVIEGIRRTIDDYPGIPDEWRESGTDALIRCYTKDADGREVRGSAVWLPIDSLDGQGARNPFTMSLPTGYRHVPPPRRRAEWVQAIRSEAVDVAEEVRYTDIGWRKREKDDTWMYVMRSGAICVDGHDPSITARSDRSGIEMALPDSWAQLTMHERLERVWSLATEPQTWLRDSLPWDLMLSAAMYAATGDHTYKMGATYIYGVPGSGKSQLAEAFAKMVHGPNASVPTLSGSQRFLETIGMRTDCTALIVDDKVVKKGSAGNVRTANARVDMAIDNLFRRSYGGDTNAVGVLEQNPSSGKWEHAPSRDQRQAITILGETPISPETGGGDSMRERCVPVQLHHPSDEARRTFASADAMQEMIDLAESGELAEWWACYLWAVACMRSGLMPWDPEDDGNGTYMSSWLATCEYLAEEHAERLHTTPRGIEQASARTAGISMLAMIIEASISSCGGPLDTGTVCEWLMSGAPAGQRVADHVGSWHRSISSVAGDDRAIDALMERLRSACSDGAQLEETGHALDLRAGRVIGRRGYKITGESELYVALDLMTAAKVLSDRGWPTDTSALMQSLASGDVLRDSDKRKVRIAGTPHWCALIKQEAWDGIEDSDEDLGDLLVDVVSPQ